MPFPDNQFDLVHTSAALHEMEPSQLRQILKVYRVLKPAGVFTWWIFTLPVMGILAGLSLFFVLFETETAWQLLKTDLAGLLEVGFQLCERTFYRWQFADDSG